MATAKGQAIADYAESKLGCAYIWGGYGEKLCTPSFRRERAEAYPSQKENIYRNCPVLSGQKSLCTSCKYSGKQAYDCAQLTRYACKAGGQELVSGANSQWKSGVWEKKGTIDSFPDVPGVILYHANDAGTMTHTGVAIGGGMAVEARSAAYGVVKTAVKTRSWTHWAAPGVLSEGAVQWRSSLRKERILLQTLRSGGWLLRRLVLSTGCSAIVSVCFSLRFFCAFFEKNSPSQILICIFIF